MNCPLRKCGRYGEVAVRVQFDCIILCHASMITLITNNLPCMAKAWRIHFLQIESPVIRRTRKLRNTFILFKKL